MNLTPEQQDLILKEAGFSEAYRKAKLLARSSRKFVNDNPRMLGFSALPQAGAVALPMMAVSPEHANAIAGVAGAIGVAPTVGAGIIGGLGEHARRAAVAKAMLASSKKTAAAHMIDPSFLYRKGGGGGGGSRQAASPSAPSPAQAKPATQTKQAPQYRQPAAPAISKGVTFQMPARPPQGK
jgi:hypothetical protein